MVRRKKKDPPKLRPRKNYRLGRSRGTVNISRFDETKVGFMLKWEAPLEYDLIVSITHDAGRIKPDWRLIDKIGYFSENKMFDSPKYERYLIEYRLHGLYIQKPRKLSSKKLEKIKKKIINR